ncbi:MAG: macro domain-containing protein [Planctomycetota bacterium]
MTNWSVIHGDLLDLRVDGLICSANPNLNLSGGVGGAFAMRFGGSMQTFLHQYLHEQGIPYIPPGRTVVAPPCGSHFRAVAHAVAIDGFYDTDVPTIVQTYLDAIARLATAGCRSIAAACLGCGYGRVESSDFQRVIRDLVSRDAAAESVTFGTTNQRLAESVRETLDEQLEH